MIIFFQMYKMTKEITKNKKEKKKEKKIFFFFFFKIDEL